MQLLTVMCCRSFAILLLSIACVNADRPTEFHEPDHLVPVDPYPGGRHMSYLEQVQERFKLANVDFAQMIVLPSFSAEYAMQLRSERNSEGNEKFTLTYASADASIWLWMPERNGEKKFKEPKIALVTVEFPEKLGGRIRSLWRRMLAKTRYLEEGTTGLDGTTFEFGVACGTRSGWVRAYGETWSPHELRSPLLFVELGHSLIDYCKATVPDRPVALKKIESKAAKLDKYLNQQAK